jgi:hypothetical protein
MLTKLNKRFKDRIIWDYKPHDNDIQIDPEYEGTHSFCDDTDVKVVDMLCMHFSTKLARCRGALWFVGETCTTVILPGDRTQQVLFEHNMIAELRKCEIFIDEEDQREYLSKLKFLCQHLMMQAPIDDEFEAKYWASNSDDNYSRGIYMWNERCIHLLQKCVFLYEESGEVEELKPDELQRNMRALTDVTFDQWCSSSQRRAYDRDVFVPSLVPELQNPKHYNRFKGLNIQYKDCREADVSTCKPLLAHVRKILCKNNEEAYNFVLKTFARIVQGVEKGHLNWIKSQVCMIFLSKQGSGKGTLTRHFRRILGSASAIQICKKKDIFGNFNDLCMGKIWVELDELLWAGNHEQAGEFKSMITEDTQMCEGKFKKTREYSSYHNYCATTNSDWAAQVDVDNRRFAAIDCDDQWSGPRTAAQTEYFRALNDPKQGPFNITLSFAKYLYELNVDNFDPAENIPSDTAGMHEQKLQSLDPIAKVVMQLLDNGLDDVFRRHYAAHYEYWTGIYAANESYTFESSCVWAVVENNFQATYSCDSNKFFLKLSKILPKTVKSIRLGKDKIPHKQFGPLNELRCEFNQYLGFKYFDA